MKEDEAKEKARKAFLGLLLLGIGPFFLATIFGVIILTPLFMPAAIFGESTAMWTRIILGFITTGFWAIVAAHEYRKAVK